MSNERHIEDLKEIRSLMEKSTRFLSLSGWSGIMAGVYALIGAYAAHDYANSDVFLANPTHQLPFLVIGLGVMAAALITGAILTYLKAKKNGQTLFDKTALRMVAHIGFPMVVGFFVWLAFAQQGGEHFMAGVLLIFYGLGLINGSKYTLNDIRILGVAHVVLGVLALFFTHYGLYFWAAGFGLGHIVYGVYMWMRYER
ncbi:MAG: hypothetical protein QMC70_09825 [Bacteroidia bacterium]|jgi:hypothetical protein|tara:strand:- start:4502 stop:5098 length:597 start_codon:yes stop_codon:yes gene_type:complete